MKRKWKKIVVAAAVMFLGIRMFCIPKEAAASEKIMNPLEAGAYVSEKYAPKKVGRKMEPEEWNRPEIKAYKFDTTIDAMTYMMTGGMKYYNSNFYKKSRMIKITAVESGALFLSVNAECDGYVAVYDGNMEYLQRLPEETMTYVKIDVKKGQTFYVMFPSDTKEALVMSYLLENKFEKLRQNNIGIQKGEGHATYHPFTVKRRSEAMILCGGMVERGGTMKFYVQHRYQGKWRRIGTIHQINDQNDADAEIYGLAKGHYRLVLQGAKTQGVSIIYFRNSVKKNVAYSKEKAIKIKLNKSKSNIYTTGERKSRWYQIHIDTRQKQRKLRFTNDCGNGKLKFKVYRFGKAEPIRVKTVLADHQATVNLPRQRWTYYIKVSKVGKRTTGSYEIKYK